jgi:hypothetical protein
MPIVVEVGNPRELGRMRGYLRKEPDGVEWISRYVKPGDVFYDIGANIGLYSILAAKRLQDRRGAPPLTMMTIWTVRYNTV